MRVLLFLMLLSAPLASFAADQARPIVIDSRSNRIAEVVARAEQSQVVIQYVDKTVDTVPVATLIPDTAQCVLGVCPFGSVKVKGIADRVFYVAHVFTNGTYSVTSYWDTNFDGGGLEQSGRIVDRSSVTVTSITGTCFHQVCRGDYYTGKYKRGLPVFSHQFAAVRVGVIRILDILSDGTVVLSRGFTVLKRELPF